MAWLWTLTIGFQKMVRVEIKGIHRVTKRLSGGRLVEYHYAWRGGPRFWRSDTGPAKQGPDYWALYQGAVSERDPTKGTFREVLRAYLASPEFLRLKPRSQKDIKRSIFHDEGIDRRFGDAPIGAFNRPEIRRIAYAWRDQIKAARTADMFMGHLSAIVSWAVDRHRLTQHHLTKTTKLYHSDRSEIIWTEEEVSAFVRGTPEWIGRILVAAVETGLRPGDLATLSRAHIQVTPRGSVIRMRTRKRNRSVSIPVTPTMAALIDATPKTRLHILAGSRGGPLTNPDRMGRLVGEHRDRLSLRSELHLYDARGTAATRLFMADASLREIAQHMGWSVPHTAKMIEIYVAQNPGVPDDLVTRLHSTRA